MRPRRNALRLIPLLAALPLLAACIMVTVPEGAEVAATPTPTFPMSFTVEEPTPTRTPTPTPTSTPSYRAYQPLPVR